MGGASSQPFVNTFAWSLQASAPLAAPASAPTHAASFSVLSYNVLVDRYATAALFKHTRTRHLAWQHRVSRLKEELVQAGADVVCLQEVDGVNFARDWGGWLKQHGYERVVLVAGVFLWTCAAVLCLFVLI